MCNCLTVLKPMVREYGGKVLNGFFNGSNGRPSSSKLTGKILSNRWKRGSYQLDSIDRGVVTSGKVDMKNTMRGSDKEIVVTSSFTIEQTQTQEGASKMEKEFDSES